MDLISIFSVITGLVQLTDFGFKIVSAVKVKYRSPDGALPQTIDADRLTQGFVQLLQRLKSEPVIAGDDALKSLVDTGISIGTDILNDLNKLNWQGERRWWMVPKKVWQEMRILPHIEESQQRLAEHRQVIHLCHASLR